MSMGDLAVEPVPTAQDNPIIVIEEGIITEECHLIILLIMSGTETTEDLYHMILTEVMTHIIRCFKEKALTTL